MPPEFNMQGQIVYGDQYNIGVVRGDVVIRRMELEAPLREVFDFLIEDRRATFGGRTRELAQIDNYLRQDTGGILAITAGAGFGKTSLIAELAGRQPDTVAYHFFTPLYERSLSEEFFLRNVVQQMAAWHGERGNLPADTDMLGALFHKYLDREMDDNRILLLDGLDEVTRWPLAPYLGRRQPHRLHIVVTIRDVGQDWRQKYRFPAGQLAHLYLGGLSTADIQDVLTAAGGKAADLATDARAVTEVSRVAIYDEGQPQLGADPFYVALLGQDLANGAITPQELAKRPSGLDAYLDNWWKMIRREAGDQAARDLFGTLTAALGRLTRADLEALNPSLVDEWAGDYFDEVLARVRRFVVGDAHEGYALVHPRLKQYLQDPRRIKAVPAYTEKLIAYALDWPVNRSHYALRNLVDHLAAANKYAALFDAISDPAFREAQQAAFGGSHVSLGDLRQALAIALEQDELLRIIRTVAAYRDTTRRRPLTHALFDAVEIGELEQALAVAGYYTPAADWPRLLYLYLAFEFAVAGDLPRSLQTARDGMRFPSLRLQVLSDNFLAVLARLLAAQSGKDPRKLLEKIAPEADPNELLASYIPAPPIDVQETADLIGKLQPQLVKYEQLAADGDSEAVISVIPLLEDEARAGWFFEDDMRLLLWKLAADPQGWDFIERALMTILPNPYVRYRDIGLEAIGRASLAAPLDDSLAQDWFRSIWRTILLTTLDQEGVTFTFDVPIFLVNEAERRGAAALDSLLDYTSTALGAFDKWGTRMRAHSGRAADTFYAGDSTEADEIMAWVASEVHGYAGLATGHLLAAANRWLEFGRPDRIDEPLTEWDDRSLASILDEQVNDVKDADFRQQLMDLVRRYQAWRAVPDLPDVDTGLAGLRPLEDEDARAIYVDYVSAHWAQAHLLDGLKAMLPLVLDRGTLVDLLLARLLHIYQRIGVGALDGAELAEAQQIVVESLTTGRPWQQGYGR